jgi:TusA-related sulfurtransferase
MESKDEIAAKEDSKEDLGRYFLDITGEVCPLTFVKAKLFLERMPEGAVAEIRLQGAEPVENVPRSLEEDGHEILGLTAEPGSIVHRLRVRKR